MMAAFAANDVFQKTAASGARSNVIDIVAALQESLAQKKLRKRGVV